MKVFENSLWKITKEFLKGNFAYRLNVFILPHEFWDIRDVVYSVVHFVCFLFFSVNTDFSLYSGNSLSQPYLGQLLGALVSGLAGRTWTGKVWALINVFPTLFLFFSFLVHNHNSFSLLASREIIISFSGIVIICSFLCLYKMQVCWVL